MAGEANIKDSRIDKPKQLLVQDSVLKQFKHYRDQAATTAEQIRTQAKETAILRPVLQRL